MPQMLYGHAGDVNALRTPKALSAKAVHDFLWHVTHISLGEIYRLPVAIGQSFAGMHSASWERAA